METISPIYFYFIYCSDILKHSFSFSSEQVIHHNFILGIVNLINTVILMLFCFKLHPLKILKFKLWIFAPFSIIFPYLLDIAVNSNQILIIQIISIILTCTAFPANPVIFSHFPIFKRFFASTFTFAIAKAVMYPVSSFGIMYITRYFGNLGLLILTLPLTIGYVIARNYFEKLEIINGCYY
ncbi:MAG: MFS type sugar transporter [Rickettsia endosymbiont of Eriopis connexa]|nr:MFS type sugar transporter [Rickettsia endosymbiont of Eriopis connexa]